MAGGPIGVAIVLHPATVFVDGAPMDDLIWLAITFGLALLGLLYIRLLGESGEEADS